MTERARTVDVVVDLELSTQPSVTLPDGARSCRVLVRLHGAPLGFVSLDTDGVVTAEQVLAAAGPALRAALAAHLADDGLTAAETPTAAPACQAHGPHLSGVRVSVVIGTRDRPERIARAVGSILKGRGDVEVVVADNGPSTDATRDWVEGLHDARVRYLRVPEPGLSRARNLGAAMTTGDVIAFTDDDVLVDAGWVEALARAFTLDPAIGLVTGMVAAAELSTESQVYFDNRVSWSSSCEPTSFRLSKDPLMPYLGGKLGTGANMALSRAAFDGLGGFDGALGPGTPARGGEDLDLFARAILAGWVLRYEPSALVWHVHRRDLDELTAQMRGYGSGLTAYLTKHALTLTGASRLTRGLAVGVLHMGGQHKEASVDPRGPELVRQERRGLVEGPLLYLRGRRLRRAV